MHVIKRHTPHAQSRERESASTHVCETMWGSWLASRGRAVGGAQVGRDPSFVIRIRARGRGGVGSRPSALLLRLARVKLPATYDITIYHTPRSTRRRSVAQPAFITHPCSSRESLTSEHLLCCEHLAPSKISGARCTVYGCSTYYCADRRGLGRRSGRAVAYEQSGYVWHTAFL